LLPGWTDSRTESGAYGPTVEREGGRGGGGSDAAGENRQRKRKRKKKRRNGERWRLI